ncbi:CybS-domain-containing protein [Delphinella strobiligena]|nr:CybS-domain-containing protein [Delphinella strobiligena]
MAAAFRPQMLRQAFAAVPAKRAFSSTITSSVPACRAAQLSRQQCLVPAVTRVAAFHSSPARAILPPLPQSIQGTVNDPVKVPHPHPTHGSYHWSFERLMSAALIPLTIAPFASGSLNPTLDALLCATLLIHSHIGFEACVTDYFPGWRVPKIRKALDWILKAATVLVGVGLYEFETNDVGLTEAIKRVWQA